MYRFREISIRAMTLAALLAVAGSVQSLAAQRTASPGISASHNDTGAKSSAGDAPSQAELHARAERLIANQHRDDNEIDQFDRIERHLDRSGGPVPRVIEDRTYRVVPTGSGTLKILLKDGATATDPADYRRQLQSWETLLEMMLRGDNSKSKTEQDKYAKRKRDRAEFIDAIDEAFLVKPAGHEMCDGRVCDVFQLDPNPAYRAHSMFQEALTNVTAKIWVDRESDQLARGEAHVSRDISFGAGILGKLYRGGTVMMEQTEIAPGVWLPKRYQYDFAGRRFFFSFEQHQVVEAGHYRRVGPPSEALAMVRNELASGTVTNGDP
jgi:hypothetical protein